uniref:Uncharacterized protein n=1 Tax=Lutzomyia longipalpis TaxID=7200 RepID=A0A7G3B6Q6_LUTLO
MLLLPESLPFMGLHPIAFTNDIVGFAVLLWIVGSSWGLIIPIIIIITSLRNHLHGALLLHSLNVINNWIIELVHKHPVRTVVHVVQKLRTIDQVGGIEGTRLLDVIVELLVLLAAFIQVNLKSTAILDLMGPIVRALYKILISSWSGHFPKEQSRKLFFQSIVLEIKCLGSGSSTRISQ